MQAERATVVELSEVRKSYRTAAGSVEALGGITAALAAGTFTAVMGPSGSGKSTLLQRALITRPQVVFADEPTGALDSATSREVLALLRGLVDEHGLTVAMVTHDPSAAGYADRALFLADGRISGELADPTAAAVAARLAMLEARS